MSSLRSHRSRSVDGRESEDITKFIGSYMVLSLFNVVDTLRPAIKELPAPSKPVIPKLRLNNSTNGRKGKDSYYGFGFHSGSTSPEYVVKSL
jgi:hypothetical protein